MDAVKAFLAKMGPLQADVGSKYANFHDSQLIQRKATKAANDGVNVAEVLGVIGRHVCKSEKWPRLSRLYLNAPWSDLHLMDR